MNGSPVESQWLTIELPRVGRKPHHAIFVAFSAPSPERGEETTVQLRIKAQADELPDDIDEYVIEHDVRIGRK